MNQSQKEKIKKFVEILEKVSYSKNPFAKNEKFYDLGLIIREKRVEFDFDDFKSAVENRGKYNFFTIDKNISENDFLKFLVETLKAKKSPVIEIKNDLKGRCLTQLKRLAELNKIQILNFDYQGETKEIFNLKLPNESRIIVIIDRDTLEKKITYPYFLRFFGPKLILK